MTSNFGISLQNAKGTLCRRSFAYFVREFWEVLYPDEKLVWNWHIEYLCRQLQKAAELVFKGLPKLHDYIINIPPGTSKSTILSVMFPAWTWVRMPNARHICVSHTQELVHDLARKCRDIVLSQKYQDYFPGITLREDQSAKGYFINNRGGWRLAVTVGGRTPTGFHGHFINMDDLIDPKKAASEIELKAANDFIWGTLASRKVDAAITVMFLVMQRLHQNDPTGNWLKRVGDKGGVKHICLPAELTDNVKPKALRKKYVNGLLDPKRLPKKVLVEKMMEGQYFYAGQYLQNPVPLGGGMFQVDKLNIRPRPSGIKFKRIVRSWDNASVQGDGDYTAGVEIALTDDPEPQVWILHVMRGQWATSDRERLKAQQAELDGRQVEIVQEQEPGSGGKDTAVTTSVRLGTKGFKVIINKPTGDKALRADPLSQQVNIGNVYLVEAPWNQEFIDEMRFFPFSTYDDQVDAASTGYNELTKPVVRIGALW